MERPGTPATGPSPIAPPRDEAAVAIAREAFGAWLRSERETRGISLEDVARVTKIQIRALERLEDAAFDELPADVFVRGFIRNYARVVGLDADKVLARYDDCGVTPGPAAAARARAQAMMSVFDGAPPARRTPQATPSTGVIAATVTPIPTTPEPVAEAAPAPVEGAEEPKPKKPRAPKKKSRGGKRRSKKTVEAAPVAEVIEPEVDDFEMTIVAEPEPEPAPEPVVVAPPVVVTPPRPSRPREIFGAEAPRRGTAPTPIPSLVIDDDDPDVAERAQAARELDEKLARDKAGRGFLPQALLDGDRGTRQGGLTLAVIILLIVATLTLSYLMRRPSSSGEGVTSLPGRALVA